MNDTRTFAMIVAGLAAVSSLTACQSLPTALAQAPTLEHRTAQLESLRTLAPPETKLFGAVFQFYDQTGQNKPNDSFAEYSKAVTQGGAALLINALHEAGNGSWFTVLDRQNIADVLQERQLIRANRQEFLGPDGRPLPPIRGLFNPGIILEGGIVAYDSNTITGGIGARYFGIGANSDYRQDNVSVALRAVSVLTGEVLVSVVVDKTVYSIDLQGGAYKFVSVQKLFELEAGISTNEPGTLAVKQAIEKAVQSLIIEGAAKNYWSFADKEQQKRLVADYLAERSGIYPVDATNDPPVIRQGQELPGGKKAAEDKKKS